MKLFDLIDDLGSELDYRLTMASFAIEEALGKGGDTGEDIQEEEDENEEIESVEDQDISDEDIKKVMKEFKDGYLRYGDAIIPIFSIEKYSSFVFGEDGIEGEVTPEELAGISIKDGQIKKGRGVVVSCEYSEYYSFYENDGIDLEELCEKLDIIIKIISRHKKSVGLL